MRPIDADALNYVRVRIAHDDGTIGGYNAVVPSSEIKNAPTIDAVPTEFVMENCNLEFVCYALTDDGEWCSERCQYSEPQPECIHRYIDRIWRKEHEQAD